MRKIFFFVAAIFVACQLLSQKSFKRNTIYFEIGGNGLVLSLNYERQITSKPGLGLHAGVALAGDKPAFPLGAKYLFNLSKQRSFLEVGAGVTLADQNTWETNYNQPETDPYKAGFIPSVGYRYNAPKGFMLRINYTPVFNKYRTELLFFGISLGWRI
jgi:hypothetical protein